MTYKVYVNKLDPKHFSAKKGGKFMNFADYLKNKDLKITNDDIDIDKLTSDLRKGYVSESEVESRVEKATKDLSAEDSRKYSNLENSYNDMVSKYDGATKELGNEKLKNAFLSHGFKNEDFEELSEIRHSVYKDIKDDNEAVSKLKERFGGTFFPQSKNVNEPSINGSQEPKKETVKVTRNTSIKDLIYKK